MSKLDLDQRLLLYETMVRIRMFDAKAEALQKEGLTPGRMHPCTGQEAVAAGVCAALQAGDSIVSTHRNAGHLIAMGADPRFLFAEYMGKASGYSRGKGGPMHLSIPEIGVLCTTGIVGNGIPVAAGAAMANLYKRNAQVVCCFFGDGASNTGSFHESLNLSAVWKLPVVYVCENNRYAETMPFEGAFAIDSVAARASSYGMAGEKVDGNDVIAVFRSAENAIARARGGKGPALIEALTYRLGPHFVGESSHYRDEREIHQWKGQDPVTLFGRVLMEEGIQRGALEALEEKAKEEVEQAAMLAKQDPPAPENELLTDVVIEEPTEAGL